MPDAMIAEHTLANGLQVAIEQLDGVASTSIQLLLPAGSAYDDDDTDGCAAVLTEMLFRGTHALTSVELAASCDLAGMQRGTHAGRRHVQMHVTTTGDQLTQSLELLFAAATDPALDRSDLEHARQLCLQSLQHLSDDPHDELGLAIGLRHLNRPFHRTGRGSQRGLSALSQRDVTHRHASCCVPGGAILCIAGACEADACLDSIGTLTGSWTGSPPELPEPVPGPRGQRLITQDTSQVHLAMAWDAPDAAADTRMLEHLVCTALGGTTSGRLFTEVRQRRSLCYSVSSQYLPGRDQGWCALHAGTTPDHAPELVATCLSEIHRVASTLTAEEIERARRSIISSMALRGESTAARAGTLAADLAATGECKSLLQRRAEYESVAVSDVQEHARRYARLEPTIVAIGPEGSLPYESMPSLRDHTAG
jgi:predicted Zn-dependent peptidase